MGIGQKSRKARDCRHNKSFRGDAFRQSGLFHKRLGLELLEDRRLLAMFLETGNTLTLELAANEQMGIVSHGESYSFSLGDTGTWTGAASPRVALQNGAAALSVTPAGLAAFSRISINDTGPGAAVHFEDSGTNAYTTDFSVVLDNGGAESATVKAAADFGVSRVDLTGPQVRIDGQLTAKEVRLTGTETLEIAGAVRAATLNLTAGLLDNSGEICGSGKAGGQVFIAAMEFINSGEIAADGSAGSGGCISIALTQRMIQSASGTVSASGVGGSGGQVTIAISNQGPATNSDSASIAGVYLSGAVCANGAGVNAVGGKIAVTGGQLDLYAVELQANGEAGGGRIRVGGDFQAQGDLERTQSVTVNHASALRADAIFHGQGGQIVVKSEQQTTFAGLATACGGTLQGDGGEIEVSGDGVLNWQGEVKVSAPVGQTGSLLLDPKNITIAGLSFTEFVDPHPAAGNKFGSSVVALSTGNVIITSPYDDLGATDAGAVYLFNGATGALVSTLRGSHAYDNVGYVSSGSPVITLSNGNYLVASPSWHNGTAANAGAVTWGSGTVGASGVVSSTNSLVGSVANDYVGYVSASSKVGVTLLANGNYLVSSPTCDNGSATDAGAVTWGSGTTGVSGVVSSANSLVGSHSNDQVGYASTGTKVTVLSNGNYVVCSPLWDNGSVTDAGAATWGSGTAGRSGLITSVNSLVGSTANDQVGSDGVTALTNGNYVVISHTWSNGAAVAAGAATWGNGTVGTNGVVSNANSLVGTTSQDYVGLSGVIPLTNGNYVVGSWYWHYNGTVEASGAATWGNGAIGVKGSISSANSLIGTDGHDQVGYALTPLTNGNYLVRSYAWNDLRGAITWGNGAGGVSGLVSSANSLVGSQINDNVGGGETTALANGNYVVCSPVWANGTAEQAGAVTWGSGTAPISGVISNANSLVGTASGDRVGLVPNLYGSRIVVVLANGNYLVRSPSWHNGAASNAGAVTWGSGAAGICGVVSSANSLVGSAANDNVGDSPTSVIALPNGNYVVSSFNWDNGAAVNAGAVTWGNGSAGVSGTISAANSLVGSAANDVVGGSSLIVLSNGNYVVNSYSWDNGAVVNVGAVTWANGTTGITGVVSSANSLIGSTASDQVGYGGVTALSNGNYVVCSYNWDNGATINAGAVTWGNGATDISGVVSSSNSFIGAQAADEVGRFGITALTNGNYVINSYHSYNGSIYNAGAVTWGNGTVGLTGVLSSTNSLMGSSAYDYVGDGGVTALTNGNYLVRSSLWNYSRGAVTWGSGTSGVCGVVSSANSLIGLTSSAGIQPVVVDNVNGTFCASFYTEAGTPPGGGTYGGRVRVGLQSGLSLSSQLFAAQTGASIMLTSNVAGTLNTGAAVTLQANNDITISSALAANNPSGNGGNLTLQAGRSLLINANLTTDNGNLTLTANETVANGVVNADRDSGSAVITMTDGTTLSLGSGTLTVNVRNSADKTYNARGAAVLQNVTAASTVLADGTTRAKGTITGPVIVNGNAVLGGTGSVTGAVVIASGGTVAPGDNGPGILSAGDVSFSPGAAFVVELNGVVPATGYDRLNVTGTVILGGAGLAVSLGFQPPGGTNFLLIDNDGGEPVTGAFAGLPEGAGLTLNDRPFHVTYRGGDGNDVVLVADPLTRTWDGGGANNNWSTAANWVGDAAPSAGDRLVFPDGAARLINVNDFGGNTLFSSLSFIGGGYNISGNPIQLQGGIQYTNTTAYDNLNLGIQLTAPQTFSTAVAWGPGVQILGAIDLNGYDLTIDAQGGAYSFIGAIGGAGNLIKTGVGQAYLSNSVPNTYTGTTIVNGGTLYAQSGHDGIMSIPGNLIIGDGVGGGMWSDRVQLRSSDRIADSANVTINSSGLLLLDTGNIHDQFGINETIASLTLTGGAVNTFGQALGTLTVLGNITTNAASTTAEIDGSLSLGGQTRTISVVDGAAATDLAVDAVVSGGGIVKAGGGTLSLTAANTYAGPTTIAGGCLVVAGSIAGTEVTVSSGAILVGNGAINAPLTLVSGTISPGALSATGQLSVNSLSMGPDGEARFRLNGASAGTQYDQLRITSAASLTGNIAITLNFAPAQGTEFMLIDHTATPASSNPITGAFTGLAQGGTISASYGGLIYYFEANYAGGDGNDLVLTVVQPRVALNWSGAGTVLSLTESIPGMSRVISISEPLPNVSVLKIDLGAGETFAGTSTVSAAGLTYQNPGSPTTSRYATIDIGLTNAISSLVVGLPGDKLILGPIRDLLGGVGAIAADADTIEVAGVNTFSANGNVDLKAAGGLTVDGGTAIQTGTGTISLAADVKADGTGDNGAGALMIGPGATIVSASAVAGAITLRGADIDIDTSSNPAVVGASRNLSTTPAAVLNGLNNPQCLAFDGSGNLYVANMSNNTVSKFAPGSTTPSATLTGVEMPVTLAFDGSGNLYVGGYNADTVAKFAPGSTTPTATLSGVSWPRALAVDSDGNLYVANYGANTVSKFAPGSTAPSATLSGLGSPWGLAIDGHGNLYVANYGANTVSKFAPDSTAPSATLTGLNRPHALAIDSRGNLYVGNLVGDTVSEFLPGSTTPDAILTGLNRPYALAVDGDGDLYVLNNGAGTVSKFVPDSTTPAATLTGLTNPLALAMDDNGSLFATSQTANTVCKFAPVSFAAPTAGAVIVRSSISTQSMSLGGTNDAVAGVNLTDAELSQIRTTSAGAITIGDAAQIGNIILTTATPAVTLGASTIITQAAGGAGRIILDDEAGAGMALNGNGGTIALNAGKGGIQALTTPNTVAEIGNATAATLNSSGGIGTVQPLQIAATALTTNSSANHADQFFSALSTLTAISLNAGSGTIHLLGGAIDAGSSIMASTNLTVTNGTLTAASIACDTLTIDSGPAAAAVVVSKGPAMAMAAVAPQTARSADGILSATESENKIELTPVPIATASQEPKPMVISSALPAVVFDCGSAHAISQPSSLADRLKDAFFRETANSLAVLKKAPTLASSRNHNLRLLALQSIVRDLDGQDDLTRFGRFDAKEKQLGQPAFECQL
jgi:autotransporter-associated beta strand protein